MRIAHVIPVMHTVPPRAYGGIESVVSSLAKAQAAAGNDVAIFAAHGSEPPAPGVTIIESAPFPTIEKLSENRHWEIEEFNRVIAMQDYFDVLHFHYEPIISRVAIDGTERNLLDSIHVPSVSTFHNRTDIADSIAYYREHTELWPRYYAFLSESHREPLSFLPHAEVVYNGIPMEDFPYSDHAGEYLLFLGRATKVKGVVEAIECAKKVGKKLIIAAKIDSTDREFYDTEVQHLIDGTQITYFGEADFAQKIELYQNALATLFPISWPEPFGLVMVESLACGTPVIAFNHGSVPEIMRDGANGFIVETVDEMARAVGRIGEISRAECRKSVENRFSVGTMAKGYSRLYERALASA